MVISSRNKNDTHFPVTHETESMALATRYGWDNKLIRFPGGGGHSILRNTGLAGLIVWVWDFCREKIFWGSSEILVWTIVS